MIEFTSTKQLEDHRIIGSRAMIGRAEGILMERFGVGPGRAYSYLRHESERSSRVLVDVALEVVRMPKSPIGAKGPRH